MPSCLRKSLKLLAPWAEMLQLVGQVLVLDMKQVNRCVKVAATDFPCFLGRYSSSGRGSLLLPSSNYDVGSFVDLSCVPFFDSTLLKLNGTVKTSTC